MIIQSKNKMKFISRNLSLLLLIYTDVLCLTPNNLEKFFSNIYSSTAQTKNITYTNVSRDKVTFHMYRTRDSPKEAILDSTNLYLLEKTKGKIMIIIHGWTGSKDMEWTVNLRDAFLISNPKGAAIIVDWKELANELYSTSSANTYDVGNFIGDMILDLVNNHRVPIPTFLLVGHSLGGHVCGFTGKRVQKNGKQLSRIIALDPAGPLFDVRPFDERLNPNDAEIVEVIHTNGGVLGFKDSCGDIDFFANGGVLQPGCVRIDLFDITSFPDIVTCDHFRACLYFIDAVLNPKNFKAKKCQQNFIGTVCDDDDILHLGDMNTVKTGNYYFDTNNERPFSKNDGELSVFLSKLLA